MVLPTLNITHLDILLRISFLGHDVVSHKSASFACSKIIAGMYNMNKLSLVGMQLPENIV